jgi:signal transduction histidine kinase
MISELKDLIAKVEQLKEDEQREIARMLRDEIQWDTTLDQTQDQLNNLAKEALQKYKAGNTDQQDW